MKIRTLPTNLERCSQLWDRIARNPDDADLTRECEALWNEAIAGGDSICFTDLERAAYTGWKLAIALEHYQNALELVAPIVADIRFTTLGAVEQFNALCELGMVQFLQGQLNSAADTYLNILSRTSKKVEWLMLQNSFLHCRAFAARSPEQHAPVEQLMNVIVSDAKLATIDADAQFRARCIQALLLFLCGQLEPAAHIYEEMLSRQLSRAERRQIRESIILCFAYSSPADVVPEGLIRVTMKMFRRVAGFVVASNSKYEVKFGEVFDLLETTRRP
jgi:hypothetical protein